MRAGLRAVLAGSGSPTRIMRAAEMFAPTASVAAATDAVAQSELVVLATPLSAALDELAADLFDGKVVIDATNYWPETDGVIPEYESASTTTLVQEHFVGATVVKALNQMAFRDLELFADRRSPVTAVGVAGDSDAAVSVVSDFVQLLGFVPYFVGPLGSSAVLGPRSSVFGAVLTPAAFEQRLRRGGWNGPQ